MGHHDQPEPQDFLISYTGHDIAWAEWIGAQLEQAGYSTFLQAWDVRPGNNLIRSLDQALRICTRCLLVLSNAYLQDGLSQAQWAAVFKQDPANEHRTLLPVKVEDCLLTGFLATHNPIDLFGLEETEASERLLAFLAAEQLQPGQRLAQDHPRQVTYPGSPVTWNLPYRRNPFFTGQEEYLSELRKRLWENQKAAVNQTEAISGLGGIGKTQLAVEYAYRHRADYTHVFWVRAETQDTIIGSYNEIADLLNLPERQEQDQRRMVAAVKRWLQKHHRYLLILDNADTPNLLAEYLPSDPTGHLLITTRSARLSEYGLGLDSPLTIPALRPELGGLLLLRRAEKSVDAVDADRALAQELSEELGGLPLALDQAGAYLVVTGKSLAAYSELYRQRRLELLKERYNRLEHPEPVVTTWDISFRAIEEQTPAAAELLRFCSFLAPEAIPEIILIKGADQLGPVLAPVAADALRLDEAVRVLRGYSLIERNEETKTLLVHRLVQAVVQERMGKEQQQQWITRVVTATQMALLVPYIENLGEFAPLISHALHCAQWIQKQTNPDINAILLLNQSAIYLGHRGQYTRAEEVAQQALTICERKFGHSDKVNTVSMNILGILYGKQGQYKRAELLLQEALDIRKNFFGKIHPLTAESLHNLAALYNEQGKYEQAQLLFQDATLQNLPMIRVLQPGENFSDLAISTLALGDRQRQLAAGLHSQGALYATLGQFEQAREMLSQALDMYQKHLGEGHPETASCMNSLAELYRNCEHYDLAEQLHQKALAIRQQQLGPDHPDTATSLNNLGLLYHQQGKDSEAESFFQQALSVSEQYLGPDHPDVAQVLNNLGVLYEDQEMYDKAENLLNRALAINKSTLGNMHTQTAQTLNNLGSIYARQGKFDLAEPLYKQALDCNKQIFGMKHPSTLRNLSNLADLYTEQGKYDKAEELWGQSVFLSAQIFGPQHPRTEKLWQLYLFVCEKLGYDKRTILFRGRDLFQSLIPASEQKKKRSFVNPMTRRKKKKDRR